MTVSSDQELLARFAAHRDESAFEVLVQRHGPRVLGVCQRVLGLTHDAEDATQAVFLVLAQKAATLQQVRSLAAWLHRVAWDIAANARQAARTRRRHEERAIQMAPSPVSDEKHLKNLQLLDEELNALPEKYREPVFLCHFQGLTQAAAAVAAKCNESTLSMRLLKARELLRERLVRRGIMLSAGVLPLLLSMEAGAAEFPAALAATTTKTAALFAAKTASLGAAVANSSTPIFLMKAALKAMFWAKVKIAAMVVMAALFVAGVSVSTLISLAHKQEKTPSQKQADSSRPSVVKARNAATVILVPRTWNAWDAFDKFERQGGARVVMFSNRRSLLVPAELRFQPVEGRKLIKAVAAARNLKVAWSQSGRYAVLYTGVADAEIERIRNDLTLANGQAAWQAAWRTIWLWDARVVPLLLKAARAMNAEVAHQAIIGLRRATWDVVLALDETAADLLVAELDSQEVNVRRDAVFAIRHVSGEKALAFIEKALADQDADVRHSAVLALGHVGGEKALALIEKALNNQDVKMRRNAICALGSVGGEKALTLIEKALNNQDAEMRRYAVYALGNIGGEKALALIEKMFNDQNVKVRSNAVSTLGFVGGEKALALIEKMLDDQDASVRRDAVRALNCVGGEKTLSLIEKMFADQDVNVRLETVRVLNSVGGEWEKALALIEKMLADQDASVRRAVIYILGRVGKEDARNLLLKQLAEEKDRDALMAVWNALRKGFAGDPTVEKALKDFKLPELPKPSLDDF
ncbi:MAG: sigma-70 family RNA polymerase sigma factor [Planctomycetota bacterium]